MGAGQKSDEELMAQYQDGDMNAFNLLYLRYEKKIYNYFLKHLSNPERSAELFQETFLKLHRYSDRYDPKLPFSGWLFTIASNIAKNEFKRTSIAKTTGDAFSHFVFGIAYGFLPGYLFSDHVRLQIQRGYRQERSDSRLLIRRAYVPCRIPAV